MRFGGLNSKIKEQDEKLVGLGVKLPKMEAFLNLLLNWRSLIQYFGPF